MRNLLFFSVEFEPALGMKTRIDTGLRRWNNNHVSIPPRNSSEWKPGLILDCDISINLVQKVPFFIGSEWKPGLILDCDQPGSSLGTRVPIQLGMKTRIDTGLRPFILFGSEVLVLLLLGMKTRIDTGLRHDYDHHGVPSWRLRQRCARNENQDWYWIATCRPDRVLCVAWLQLGMKTRIDTGLRLSTSALVANVVSAHLGMKTRIDTGLRLWVISPFPAQETISEWKPGLILDCDLGQGVGWGGYNRCCSEWKPGLILDCDNSNE